MSGKRILGGINICESPLIQILRQGKLPEMSQIWLVISLKQAISSTYPFLSRATQALEPKWDSFNVFVSPLLSSY